MTYRLYADRADWFELLTVPEPYRDEAERYRRTLSETCDGPLGRLLELGAGAGNNAVHLKRHLELTLTDLSPRMLELSRRRNPECEHVRGDMRTLRLGRTFDGVFVHDAVLYMTTLVDLEAAVATAHAHCRPGGAALFVPKYFRETFTPITKHGGHDGTDGRSLRYLHWATDPDPDDTTYSVLLTFVVRDGEGGVEVETEEHVNGLFSRREWTTAIVEAGFEIPTVTPTDNGLLVAARRPTTDDERSA